MSRRIAIELTSNKGDGTWTWRAAGAREPRGVISADLLPKGAGISSVFTAEVQSDMDGIAVLAVIESEDTRTEPETIEVLGTGKHSSGVNFKGSGRGGKRRRGAGTPPGGFGDDGFGDARWTRQGRAGPRGAGPGRPGQARPGGRRKKGAQRGDQDSQTRLRPDREHRKKWLASVPPEHARLAEQIASGKLRTRERQQTETGSIDANGALESANPATAYSASNASVEAAEGDKTQSKTSVAKSEKDAAAQLLAEYRTAEWQDRADFVLANFEKIDLAEIRMLVADSGACARTPETRSQADEAKEKLTERTERMHGEWLADLAVHLSEGRVLRALRQSGQPPKAGVPLPLDLVKWLASAAADILTPEAQPERWSKTLQALAVSPVRRLVRPEHPPATLSPELTDTLTELAPRFPHIAALFAEEETEEEAAEETDEAEASEMPEPVTETDEAEESKTEESKTEDESEEPMPDAGEPAEETAT